MVNHANATSGRNATASRRKCSCWSERRNYFGFSRKPNDAGKRLGWRKFSRNKYGIKSSASYHRTLWRNDISVFWQYDDNYGKRDWYCWSVYFLWLWAARGVTECDHCYTCPRRSTTDTNTCWAKDWDPKCGGFFPWFFRTGNNANGVFSIATCECAWRDVTTDSNSSWNNRSYSVGEWYRRSRSRRTSHYAPI